MSELAEVKSAIEGLRHDLTEMVKAQATTSARLSTLGDQWSAQIGVLFDRRDGDRDRIQRIELDYTRKADHQELEKRVLTIDRQVAKWLGALALLQIVLSIAGAWIMRTVMG